MSRFVGYVWVAIAFFSLFPSFAFSAPAADNELEQIHILADPSITVPLVRIVRDFTRTHHVSANASFAPIADQAHRIEQGSEADILIATRANTIQSLKNQGLIDVYSHVSIAKNRLALVTYKENRLDLILIPRLPLASILERIDPGFSFVLGDPDTQDVGLYAIEAMQNYEIAGDLEPYFRFIESPLEMRRAIATRGGYGVMLLTEALRDPNLKVLGVFPQAAHNPITYQALVVAGENMGQARQFLDYLTSPKATAVFTEYGFEPVVR